MSALEAGLATLPAAAAMIAITPLITPLAAKIGARLRDRRSASAWPRSVRGAGVRRGVVDLRRVRAPADRALGRPRARERAGVVGLDRRVSDERWEPHPASRTWRATSAASLAVAAVATIYNSVHERQDRRRRVALGGARRRPLAVRASDGDLLRSGYRDRAAHGAPPSGASHGGRPRGGSRGGRLAHDPDPADASTLATGRSAQGRWAAGALGRHLGRRLRAQCSGHGFVENARGGKGGR